MPRFRRLARFSGQYYSVDLHCIEDGVCAPGCSPITRLAKWCPFKTTYLGMSAPCGGTGAPSSRERPPACAAASLPAPVLNVGPRQELLRTLRGAAQLLLLRRIPVLERTCVCRFRAPCHHLARSNHLGPPHHKDVLHVPTNLSAKEFIATYLATPGTPVHVHQTSAASGGLALGKATFTGAAPSSTQTSAPEQHYTPSKLLLQVCQTYLCVKF